MLSLLNKLFPIGNDYQVPIETIFGLGTEGRKIMPNIEKKIMKTKTAFRPYKKRGSRYFFHTQIT